MLSKKLLVLCVGITVVTFAGLQHGLGEKRREDVRNAKLLGEEGVFDLSRIIGVIATRTPADMVRWEYDYKEGAWISSRPAPECPPIVFESPVDVSKATSILYPGQYRGEDGGYRAHGGFRFDTQTSLDVEIKAPFDGYVWRGARYLVDGEIQYVFDIVNPCGIMHRFGHLRELSPKFQELAEAFPFPKEGDSRTTETRPVWVESGEVIATQTGLPGNVFLDWGAYDLRQENKVAQDLSYRKEHEWQGGFAFFALCWLDYIPMDDQIVVKNLPGGDFFMGESSDYCGG